MILSTQVVDNKDQGEDSSSESDIKNEGLNELKNIIKSNLDSKKEKISQIGKKSKKNITNLDGGDDSSYNLSKIEFKNQSINSSMRSLSRGEDFIQKDILQVLNGQTNVRKYFNNNILIYINRKKMKKNMLKIK
jgi:hypothetical protein